MPVTSNLPASSPVSTVVPSVPTRSGSIVLNNQNASGSSPAVSLAGDTVSIATVSDAAPIVYDRPVIGALPAVQVSTGNVAPDGSGDGVNTLSPESSNIPDGVERIEGEEQTQERGVSVSPSQQADRKSAPDSSSVGLSDQQRQQVAELSVRDQAVRAHEQAHKAVGGQHTGAISLSFQTGPDGRRYAIGGEVSIDVSPVSGNPLATIAKMRTVKAAANAPADPSPQDRKVAATASRILSRALSELSAEKRESANSAGERNANADRADVISKSYAEIIGLVESDNTVKAVDAVIDAIV